MAKTTQVTLRIDENLKDASNYFFESCGLSFNQGIQLLLRNAITSGKIVISPHYNSETLQALAEAEEISAHPEHFEAFSSAADLIESIKNERD